MKRRWRKLVIVLGVLLCLYVAYRLTLQFMVEAKLNEIRTQGYPVTLAELDKWYPQPPPGENAADLYLQAFRLYVPRPRERPSKLRGYRMHNAEDEVTESNAPPCARLVHFSQGLSPEEIAAVSSNVEALAVLHNRPTMKICRYPVDLTIPSEHRRLPHLNQIREGNRLLTTEAIIYADNGEQESSSFDLMASIDLARSLAKEPCIISQIVRLDCHKRTIGALDRILNRKSFSDDEFAGLMASFSTIDDAQAMPRAQIGDRCDRIALIQGLMPPFATAILDFPGVREHLLLGVLKRTDQLLQAAHNDYPSRVRAVSALTAKWENSPQDGLIFSFTFGIGDPVISDAVTIADARCAIVALATERYRLGHGRLPQTLDELVPSYLKTVPVDPFDGRELRYRKLSNGYVIYSLCKDGKNDGGDEKKDITFTVER